MATKNQIIERLKLGERLVKCVKNKSMSLTPSNIKVQWRTYRKLLFEKTIISQTYSKYDDMEWFIINPEVKC